MREAKPLSLTAERRCERPTADMNEPPFKAGRQKRQRRQQVVIAFLGNQPADRQENDGISRVAAVPTKESSRRWRKALKIEPMVAEPDGVQARRKAREVAAPYFRASHNPFCFRQLCACLPGRSCPDVFGMC